jgi:MFS family permease
MSQAASVAIRPAESRLIAAVCAAHLMSHYYMLMLAPLLAYVRDDFGVSFIELGLALTVFNVVSAAAQTPVGFLVDRIGARAVLIAGLALCSLAYAVAGLVHSYWLFVAMYGVAGLGNTVYHPSDYSLLSRHTPPKRLGQIFSYHTFAGMLGSAIAPVTLIYMQTQVGWRGAYLITALVGFVVMLAVAAQPEPAIADTLAKPSGRPSMSGGNPGWRLLFSLPIVLNLVFFMLTSITYSGLSTYLVVALNALHGTTSAVANASLTSLLAFNALGVLVGGLLAGRSAWHALIAAVGLAIGGVVIALIGLVDFAPVALVSLLGLSGLAIGTTYPSRDMLVRAITPPDAFGRVFGFVSTGFNIGASVGPMIYGLMMDNDAPRSVFLFSAAVSVLSIFTVTFGTSRRGATA